MLFCLRADVRAILMTREMVLTEQPLIRAMSLMVMFGMSVFLTFGQIFGNVVGNVSSGYSMA